MKPLTLFVILLFCAGWAFSDTEDLKVQVFEIENRNVGTMYPVVEHLKSSEGKISMDQGANRLIVIDYPQNISKMAEVIGLLDIPAKQVEIRVVIVELTDAFLGRHGIIPGKSVIAPDKFDAMIYLISNSKETQVRSSMTVLATSGEPARIQLSREEEVKGVVASRNGRTVVVQPSARSAGDFLEVLPIVNADGTIDMSLRPVMSEFQDSRTVYERSVVTKARIMDGDTIVIGDMYTQGSEASQESLPHAGIALPERYQKDGKRVVMFLTARITDRSPSKN